MLVCSRLCGGMNQQLIHLLCFVCMFFSTKINLIKSSKFTKPLKCSFRLRINIEEKFSLCKWVIKVKKKISLNARWIQAKRIWMRWIFNWNMRSDPTSYISIINYSICAHTHINSTQSPPLSRVHINFQCCLHGTKHFSYETLNYTAPVRRLMGIVHANLTLKQHWAWPPTAP